MKSWPAVTTDKATCSLIDMAIKSQNPILDTLKKKMVSKGCCIKKINNPEKRRQLHPPTKILSFMRKQGVGRAEEALLKIDLETWDAEGTSCQVC